MTVDLVYFFRFLGIPWASSLGSRHCLPESKIRLKRHMDFMSITLKFLMDFDSFLRALQFKQNRILNNSRPCRSFHWMKLTSACKRLKLARISAKSHAKTDYELLSKVRELSLFPGYCFHKVLKSVLLSFRNTESLHSVHL